MLEGNLTPATVVLASAKVKYRERARLLLWLSMTVANLEETDDGDYTTKIRLLNQMANKIGGSPNLPIGERARIYEQLAETVDSVLKVSEFDTEEAAIELLLENQKAMGLKDELRSLLRRPRCDR